MHQRPVSITITLILILLGALVWLALGVALALNAHPGFPDELLARGLMAALSITAGCVVFVALFFLARRRRLAYIAMLGILAIASLVVFMDDVGLVDVMFLALNLIPLVLLIKDRAWYKPAAE
jgi:hypothetical protein